MSVRPEVYSLIEFYDYRDGYGRSGRRPSPYGLSRDQRVRQALVDLRNDGDRACMCDEARDLLRSRVVRAAVLAVNCMDAFGGLVQRYTREEADVWADMPYHEEALHFVRVFFGSPNLTWLRVSPWFSRSLPGR